MATSEYWAYEGRVVSVSKEDISAMREFLLSTEMQAAGVPEFLQQVLERCREVLKRLTDGLVVEKPEKATVAGMTDEELVRLWVRTKPGDALRVALAVPEQRRMAMAVGKYREWLPGDTPSEKPERVIPKGTPMVLCQCGGVKPLEEPSPESLLEQIAAQQADAHRAEMDAKMQQAWHNKPAEKPCGHVGACGCPLPKPVSPDDDGKQCGGCSHWHKKDDIFGTCEMSGGTFSKGSYRCGSYIAAAKPAEKSQDIEKTCGSCRHWDNGCSSRGCKACSVWSERETIKEPEPATNPVIPKTVEFPISTGDYGRNDYGHLWVAANWHADVCRGTVIKSVRLVVEVE